MTPKKKNNALIYARVSTVKQEKRGLSIPGQIERCQKKAEESGYTVTQTFTEAESAKEEADKREIFQDAIAYALQKDNQIGAFVVYDTSRFARRREDSAIYKRMLRKAGVAIVYAEHNFDTDSEDDMFVEGIFELLDERYSRVLARVTTRGMIDNAKQGHVNGGTAPVGYRFKKLPNNKTTYEPDPAYTGVVERIFSLALQGNGCINISKILNSEGIRTPRGRKWTTNTIHNVLTNIRYCGDTLFTIKKTKERHHIKDTHTPLIDRSTFNRVQEILKARSPKRNAPGSTSDLKINPNRTVYFSGILYCGLCGSSMVATTGRGKSGKTYHYYECSAHRKSGSCPGQRINARTFDKTVLSFIQKNLFTKRNVQRIAKTVKSLIEEHNIDLIKKQQKLHAEISALQDRRSRLLRVLETSDTFDPEDLAPRISELRSEEQKKGAQLNELHPLNAPAEIDPARLKTFFQDLIKTATPEELVTFLRRFDFRINALPDRISFTANPSVVFIEKREVVAPTGFEPVLQD